MKYILLVLFFCFAFNQEKIDFKSLAKIKTEGLQKSQIMNTLSILSDRYGSRLIGTPDYFEAIQWAQSHLKKLKLANVKVESFDGGQRGWTLKSSSVEMIQPRYMKINALPKAWTASTNGIVESELVHISELSLAELIEYRGKLNGKILLIGDIKTINPNFNSFSDRFSNEKLNQAKQSLEPYPSEPLGFISPFPIALRLQQIQKASDEEIQLHQFLMDEGVAATLEASDFDHGIVHVEGTAFLYRGDLRPVPSFVIATEQFNRLIRLHELNESPKIRLHSYSDFHEKAEYNVNLTADIRGTDANLNKELVIVGAHFDSWHGASGATDNAAGSAVILEAVRILKQLKLPLKRTVRLALWGGEEQGYFGSTAYVNRHFGDVIQQKPKRKQQDISVYLNVDNGGGKIRGLYLQGNENARHVFDELLRPFETQSSNHLTIENTSWTDHEIFDALNIPAFQFIQDPINYMTVTHHTNLDLYDYILEDDMKENAVIVAYLIYQIANRSEKIPRKD